MKTKNIWECSYVYNAEHTQRTVMKRRQASAVALAVALAKFGNQRFQIVTERGFDVRTYRWYGRIDARPVGGRR